MCLSICACTRACVQVHVRVCACTHTRARARVIMRVRVRVRVHGCIYVQRTGIKRTGQIVEGLASSRLHTTHGE